MPDAATELGTYLAGEGAGLALPEVIELIFERWPEITEPEIARAFAMAGEDAIGGDGPIYAASV